MNNISVRFDGNGYIAADSASQYNFGGASFSVEAWICGMAPGTLISRSPDATSGLGGFNLSVTNDGSIMFAIGFAPPPLQSDPTVAIDGLWHHIAAVRQDELLSIYVDGALAAQGARRSQDSDCNQRLTIGITDRVPASLRNPFTGLMSEVRVWQGALDQPTIQAGLFARKLGNEPALVGYWPFALELLRDRSRYQNATSQIGDISFSTDAPPVSDPFVERMTWQFSSVYETYIGNGSDRRSGGMLYLTGAGGLIYGASIVNPVFTGNTVSWEAGNGPAPANASSAQITFALGPTALHIPPYQDYLNGWIQVPASGPRLDFFGLRTWRRFSACNVIQNSASGAVLDSGAGQIGTPVLLQSMSSESPQLFCRQIDGAILHMKSGLVLASPEFGPAAENQAVTLQTYQPGYISQLWTIAGDGSVRSRKDDRFAIAASGTATGSAVVLKMAAPADPAQLWLSMSTRQIISHAKFDLVLAVESGVPALGAAAIGETRKYAGNGNQLWYFTRSYVVSHRDGLVLSIRGGVEREGAGVVLAAMSPATSGQTWNLDGDRILTPSGNFALAVSRNASGSTLVLTAANQSSDAQQWNLLQQDARLQLYKDPANARRRVTPEPPSTGNINYRITIQTANELFGGTDDLVQIALIGDNGQRTALAPLTQSKTHSDPFERGNTDVFEVSLKDVGTLRGFYLQYGVNTWFGGDRWVVGYVSVHDPVRMMSYNTGTLFWGNGTAFVVPHRIMIWFIRSFRAGGDDTMYVSQYPATVGGKVTTYLEHTYLVVEDSEKGLTYFDAAGGHTPPAGYTTTAKTIQTKVSLNTAVKMATSFDLDAAHPWKRDYGMNDVAGQETCGIVASGWINWGGQCHQIVNRLLHVGNPAASLEQANPIPWGYGLTSIAFGPYGVSFSKWCRENNFVPPLNDTDYSVYGHISRYLGSNKEKHLVFYYATDLAGQLKNDDSSEMTGPLVRKFIQAVHNAGIDVPMIASLIDWPEATVRDEL
ncbi:MAG TPA: ricin-type beta-trefoil lectin domain protein [Bryobacteraceae bacterium]|nr:ricin-type beta-trefoil lectin domain protein [Bryobacteraceae bacterium]